MKRLFLLLSLCPAALAGLAAGPSAVGDTIIDVVKAHEVVLSEAGDSLTLDIAGTQSDSTFHFRYTRDVGASSVTAIERRGGRWDAVMKFLDKFGPGQRFSTFRFHLGFLSPLGAPAGLDASMASSIEAMVEAGAIHFYPRNERHDLSLGLAWEGADYQLRGRGCLRKDAQGKVVVGDYPEGARIDESHLWTISITLPFRYTYHFSRRVNAYVSANVRFNVFGRISSKYWLDGLEMEETSKSIHQNPVTLDFMAGLSVRGLGFYVKGSPCRVLKKDYGPGFRNLSVGLSYQF